MISFFHVRLAQPLQSGEPAAQAPAAQAPAAQAPAAQAPALPEFNIDEIWPIPPPPPPVQIDFNQPIEKYLVYI